MKPSDWVIAAAVLIALGGVLSFAAWIAWPLALVCLAVATLTWWGERVHP